MAAVVRDLHFPKFRNFEHFPIIETLHYISFLGTLSPTH
jgi:hypothetical protein